MNNEGFYHVISVSPTTLLQISNIGTSADKCNNHFGPGYRNIYLIHYIVGGKGKFNGIELGAGKGFLLRPDDFGYYYPDERDPWEYLWITSVDRNMENLFACYDTIGETNTFDYDYINEINEIISVLHLNHQKVLAPSVILEMFLHIFNNQIKSSENHDISSTEMYFSYAVNYINTNLHSHITINLLTGFLGISQPYLYRIFKHYCGKSPKEYICEKKLVEAKRQFIETNKSISAVAESLGFNDVMSFSKFFTTKTGISPTQFLKQADKTYKV